MYKPTEGTIVGPVGFAVVEVLVVRIVLELVVAVTLPEEVIEEFEKPVDDVVEDARLYSSRRLPAPQYSRLFPGHKKLQSAWLVALTLPVPSVLPQ